MAQYPVTICPKLLANILIPLLNCPVSTSTIGVRNICNKKASPYVFKHPEKYDYHECLKLMWATYMKNEPIVKYLSLTKASSYALHDHMFRAISQQLSLIVKTRKDNEIVGVCINTVSNIYDPPILERFAATLDNVKLRRLFLFWAYVQKLPMNCNNNKISMPRIFEIAHLFMRKKDKELSNELVRRSIEMGIKKGYQFIRLNANGAESACIAEEQGMNLICELPYCSYFGAHIKPIINPPPPDHSLKVYMKMPCKENVIC